MKLCRIMSYKPGGMIGLGIKRLLCPAFCLPGIHTMRIKFK